MTAQEQQQAVAQMTTALEENRKAIVWLLHASGSTNEFQQEQWFSLRTSCATGRALRPHFKSRKAMFLCTNDVGHLRKESSSWLLLQP